MTATITASSTAAYAVLEALDPDLAALIASVENRLGTMRDPRPGIDRELDLDFDLVCRLADSIRERTPR
jgi:hypothetical protein